jgi:hypothetical protein
MNFKILFISIFIAIIYSCSKPGELNGNVDWKYNDLVGNKPDAGAQIRLFSIENPLADEPKYSHTTDINGNYKIENIEAGEYIIIANSKNTFSYPRTQIENLRTHSKELVTIGINLSVDDLLFPLQNLTLLTDLSAEDPKEYQKHSEDLNKRISKLISDFPESYKMKFGWTNGYNNSIYIKKIKIESGRSSIENIDFGFKNN